VQLALFADTIIATFLPAGALSALYYADRIHQLPIGVVGIAVGIVLLPEMARRLAAGDAAGAAEAQGRAIELTLLLSVPFVAGALAIPELVMRALFARGAFTADDALAAAATLAAYGTGLLAFVLLRCFMAPFHARGDTATPVKAALIAAFANVLLKIVLVGPLAQVGLALATAAGAWINLALLAFGAKRRRLESPGVPLERAMRLLGIGVVLGAFLYAGELLLAPAAAGLPALRDEALLALLLISGAALYFLLVLALLGRQWLRGLLRDTGAPAAKPEIPVAD
jgi:putative peptidoglycan lipid II flippase